MHELFDLMFSGDNIAKEHARDARRHTHPGVCGHQVTCYREGEHGAPRYCFSCSHYSGDERGEE
jgi:hypothetical protein